MRVLHMSWAGYLTSLSRFVSSAFSLSVIPFVFLAAFSMNARLFSLLSMNWTSLLSFSPLRLYDVCLFDTICALWKWRLESERRVMEVCQTIDPSIDLEDLPLYNCEQCQETPVSCNVPRGYEFAVDVVWQAEKHRAESFAWHASDRQSPRMECGWVRHGNELRHDSKNGLVELDRWIEGSAADVWRISLSTDRLRCERRHRWIRTDNGICQLDWQYEWFARHGDHRGFSRFDRHQDTENCPEVPNNRTIWSAVSLVDWPYSENRREWSRCVSFIRMITDDSHWIASLRCNSLREGISRPLWSISIESMKGMIQKLQGVPEAEQWFGIRWRWLVSLEDTLLNELY